MIEFHIIEDRVKEEVLKQGASFRGKTIIFEDEDCIQANQIGLTTEYVLPDGLCIYKLRGNLTIKQPPRIILSPAQFTAARALASAFHHLWSSVPDGTYDVDDIELYSSTVEAQFAGISAPWIKEETVCLTTRDVVYHRTGGIAGPGNGRLSWEVNPSGNIVLMVHRPISVAKPISESDVNEEDGYIVARLQILNDDDLIFDPCKDEDYVYSVSRYSHVESTNNHTELDESLRDDLLFERHAWALVRPLVALLTANVSPPNYREYIEGEDFDKYQVERHEIRQEFRKTYIDPAVEKAKNWLKPLFDAALPDPLPTDVEPDFQYPETYWIHPDEYGERMAVFHRGNSFPVESEKTAVHAVLLLKANPDIDFVEAIKTSVKAEYYRPDKI